MTQLIVTFLIAAAALAVGASAAKAADGLGTMAPLSKSVLQRVAFIGDSITDGNTYPQLVRDSLAKSRQIDMIAMNAGIGGNTMQQMHDRLQRDVLDHKPTLVTISAGANDAVKGVTVDQYEASMRDTVATLTAHKIPVILLTNCWWAPKTTGHPVTEGYDAVIRHIAADYNLRVAEVNKQMSSDDAAGLREHSIDGHPGYTGQKSIARAVLDAMGYADVPVVDRVNAQIDKDVLLDWQIRPLAAAETPLTDAAVAALKPDQTWKTVHLPFASTDYTGSDFESLGWLDDMRQEGMATQMANNVAPGGRYVMVATIDEHRGIKAVLQTGGELVAVWINGQKVLQNDGTHGWHIGRDATPIDLHHGSNTLVVESGGNCWVRVGDKPMW